MKQNIGTLENLVAGWQTAPADRRAAALRVLQGAEQATGQNGPRVLRFADAAKQLSVTPRCLSYAVRHAGIQTVKLPGRSRAFGIRATDLDRLVEGQV